MKLVITGGGGFLGRLIAERACARGDDVVLADRAFPAEGLGDLEKQVEWTEMDVADAPAMHRLIDGCGAVIHLASMVSSGAEADFDAAMRVNLDGGRNVLMAARENGPTTKVLFTSSLAVFGSARMPAHVDEMTRPVPQNTYGMTKAVLELMINDMSRKEMLDGRVARLPTIIVRPGKPNAAASSFASGVIREPVTGQVCHLPVPREMSVMVGGYRTCADGLLALLDADAAAFGDDRVVNLPNRTVTVADMIAATAVIAERHGLDLGSVVDAPDAQVASIVGAWPTAMTADRALALGCPAAPPLETLIEDFVSDYVV